MGILLLLLELYFAAMLGVSGLAKIEEPAQFANTLRRHRVLPSWSITAVSRAIPYLEVLLAISLIIDFAAIVTGFLTALLFGCFLIVEIILIVTGRATDCGCYGLAYPRKVDGVSAIASGVLVALATLHLWEVAQEISVGVEVRLPFLVLFLGIGAWLTSKMIARRRARNSLMVAIWRES